MNASEHEIVVHEVALEAEGDLTVEPFLGAKQGSFFVSRPAELVLIEPSQGGVSRLPAKVEQLVAKGLHHIVVSMKNVGDLENDDLKVLMQVKEVIDRCVGSLSLCNVDPGIDHRLRTLGLDEGLTVVTDRDAAVRTYQDSAQGDATDEEQAKSTDDANNWGWGSDEAMIEDGGPPRVPVAELLVEDAELGKLLKDVTKIVERTQKKHVSLRMHFGRQITSDDVSILTSVRDFLAAKGGQLALVSLQADVIKWLKLLEFDREFLIAESADDADLAHRRQAAGEVMATPPPRPKPLPAPPRPTPQPEVTSVAFESEVSLAIDTGGPPSEELDALRADLAKAVSQAAQLKSQVSQLRDGLQQAEQAESQAKRRAKELDESLRRDERRIREIEQARERAEERAKAAEETQSSSHGEAQRLEGEVRALRQQLDSTRGSHDERRGELQERINELEAENQRLQASGGGSGQSTSNGAEAELQRRITSLEDEKAKILTEAEEEILRLSEAHDMLREELQSAGEMIARLGRELELS